MSTNITDEIVEKEAAIIAKLETLRTSYKGELPVLGSSQVMDAMEEVSEYFKTLNTYQDTSEERASWRDAIIANIPEGKRFQVSFKAMNKKVDEAPNHVFALAATVALLPVVNEFAQQERYDKRENSNG